MTTTTLTQTLLAALLATAPAVWAAGVADSVQTANPSVRMVPPGQDQTGAYVTLRNTGQHDHALVKATSPAARVTELHTVVDEGGMKKMRPVPKMDIKAGSETKLQPGGLHIMLIGLQQPLHEGAHIAITLTFEDGSSKEISAPVRAISAPGAMKPGH
jgi:periplasmic copper chaperone A